MEGASGMVPAARRSRAEWQAQWRASGLWTDQLLGAAAARGAQRWPHTRIVFGSRQRAAETTVARAWSDAQVVASALKAIGLEPGDRLVIQVPSWEEGLLAFLGALQLGLVVIPVVHIYGAAELGFILRQTGARALVVPDRWRKIDYLARVAQLGETPQLEHVIVVGTPPAHPQAIAWTAMLKGAGAAVPLHEGSADDVFAINFTSGTTSAPKGVMHTQRGLLAELGQSDAVRADRDAGVLIPNPAGHIGGILAMLRPFVCGEETVFLDQWDGELALELARRHAVSRMLGGPFHLQGIIEASGGAPIGKLCQVIVGGASVAPSLVEHAERVGLRACRSWGSTEVPIVTLSAHQEPLAARAGTDGMPLPGCALCIVDDEGNELPAGQPGEILVVAPEMFAGYLDADLDRAAFDALGWFRTGDVGVLDSAGRVTIVDRKKDVIIRGGENISSKEVEDILSRHPAIVSAAAVGAPDATYGERVAVFVELKEGHGFTMAELQAHFRSAGVAIQKTPEHLEVVAGLPRNTAGKVLKTELRARLVAAARER